MVQVRFSTWEDSAHLIILHESAFVMSIRASIAAKIS
jgi:hypothetical protein